MNAPARVVATVIATALTLVVTAGSAWADSPTGDAWPAAPERSLLDNVLLFGGGTVGLFVIIALFGLLTARNNYVPPAPSTDLEKAPGSDAAHH